MSEAEGKNIPEWSIFDRLNELEDITLKLMEKDDTLEPTLKDTAVIAKDAFILATLNFVRSFIVDASTAVNRRALKDELIAYFKRRGMSEKTRNLMEETLVDTCERLEKNLK
jgi:hypothetical protein